MTESNTDPSYTVQSNLRFILKSVRLLHNKLDQEMDFFDRKEALKVPQTSYKTFTFIQKTLDKAECYPERLEPKTDIDSLKEHMETLKFLQNIEFALEQFEGNLEELIRIMRFQLYKECKSLYEELHDKKLALSA